MQWMGTLRPAALLALFAAVACDGGTTGPAAPASLVAMTATTQNAEVATPVPVPPAVRVSDDRGRGLAGVSVAFAVTGGNGSVAASSITDAGGVAVAQGWVMGTVAEENALTASVGGIAPVVFRAAAAAGAPTGLEKAGGDAQSAAVATVLADSIGVRVVDQFGNGVPGQVVNFAASSGTLNAARATTGAQGHARVSLVAPNRPGTVQVFAGMGSFPSLTFAITVRVGPPAAMSRMAGDGQTAYSGTAVAVAPTVRVTDAFGNPVPGSTVRFAPAPGSGVVTGGVALTGTDGRAQVSSWVLGEPGVNTLTASVGGVDSLQFTATALEPCGNRTYTLFTTITDELLPGRCNVGGRNAEIYAVTVPSAQCVEFRMNSGMFDTFLYLVDNTGNIVAANDDSDGSLNSLIRTQVSAGTYYLGAAGYSGGIGTFQLTSSPVAAGDFCGSLQSRRAAPKPPR
jgi:hypothetical protein